MLNKIKNWLSEKKKNKWFKVAAVAAILAISAITMNVINKDNENGESESTSIAENTDEKEDSESRLHVGIGHIIMLGVFTAAYGIDKIIVYKNKLEDDKKYNEYKEE